MNRTELHGLFMAHLHAGDTPAPASQDDLARMESELDIQLPASFVAFMQSYGGAYTPALLDIIVDGGVEMNDLQNITGIAESIDGTKGSWSAGMPGDLVAFGNDCMGNLFCFKRRVVQAERPDESPVWLFDHEFVNVRQVADSFDQWLLSYVKLKNPNTI